MASGATAEQSSSVGTRIVKKSIRPAAPRLGEYLAAWKRATGEKPARVGNEASTIKPEVRYDTGTAEGRYLKGVRDKVASERDGRDKVRQLQKNKGTAHDNLNDHAKLGHENPAVSAAARRALIDRGVNVDAIDPAWVEQQTRVAYDVQGDIKTARDQIPNRGARLLTSYERLEGRQLEKIDELQLFEARAGEGLRDIIIGMTGRTREELIKMDDAELTRLFVTLPDLSEPQRRQLHAHYLHMRNARELQHSAVAKLMQLEASRIGRDIPADELAAKEHSFRVEADEMRTERMTAVRTDIEDPSSETVRDSGVTIVNQYMERIFGSLADNEAMRLRIALGITEEPLLEGGNKYVIEPDGLYDQLIHADYALQKSAAMCAMAVRDNDTRNADHLLNMTYLRQVASNDRVGILIEMAGINAFAEILDARQVAANKPQTVGEDDAQGEDEAARQARRVSSLIRARSLLPRAPRVVHDWVARSSMLIADVRAAITSPVLQQPDGKAQQQSPSSETAYALASANSMERLAALPVPPAIPAT